MPKQLAMIAVHHVQELVLVVLGLVAVAVNMTLMMFAALIQVIVILGTVTNCGFLMP
jgi:hypothetical protein